MTRPYFTSGYSAADLAQLDATVAEILRLWRSVPGSPTGAEAVAIARDLTERWFPNTEALLAGLRAAHTDSD